MQSWWYMWLQGISLASSPSWKASLQTAQWESAPTWQAATTTVGMDSTAALEAGGLSQGRTAPKPPASIWASCSRRRSKPDPMRKSDMLSGSGRRPDPAPSS
uniref:Secreted protein n=1 Tax=Triticum urartu TaxID=4572 RepID=A0A8R7Q0S1_TRIUA